MIEDQKIPDCLYAFAREVSTGQDRAVVIQASGSCNGGTKYTRSDIHDAEIARYKEAVRRLVNALGSVMDAVSDMPADPDECWPEEWAEANEALSDPTVQAVMSVDDTAFDRIARLREFIRRALTTAPAVVAIISDALALLDAEETGNVNDKRAELDGPEEAFEKIMYSFQHGWDVETPAIFVWANTIRAALNSPQASVPGHAQPANMNQHAAPPDTEDGGE